MTPPLPPPQETQCIPINKIILIQEYSLVMGYESWKHSEGIRQFMFKLSQENKKMVQTTENQINNLKM